MIKRLIGCVGTVAIVAIVVFAVLGRKGYSSAIDFGCDVAPEETPTTDTVQEEMSTDAVIDSIDVNQLFTK